MNQKYENLAIKYFNLPLAYDTERNGFKNFIRDYLEAYQQDITSANILEQSELKKLNSIILAIDNSLEYYYVGQTASAYFELEKGIEQVINEILMVDTDMFQDKQDALLDLYRIRSKENADGNVLSRGEMFHLPFNMRDYVSTQRFSIPGLPSIYLGSSMYVCWEELGRPNLKNVISSYWSYKKKKGAIINLAISFSELKEEIEATKNFLGNRARNLFVNYCIIWPLIVACTVKVKNKSGKFKPEYIIPQFLLQFVTKNKDIYGIKYFSASGCYYEKENEELFCNYVFPAKTGDEEVGYCKELEDIFTLTKGIPWQIFEIHKSAEGNSMPAGETYIQKLSLISEDTPKVIYGKTDFGKFEKFLKDKVETAKVTYQPKVKQKVPFFNLPKKLERQLDN